MTSILLVSLDTVDAKMAGPGIRYYELAKALGQQHSVTLAVPGRSAPDLPALPGVRIRAYHGRGSLRHLLAGHDTMLIQLVQPRLVREARRLGIRIVLDCYDPVIVEGLAGSGALSPAAQRRRHERLRAWVGFSILAADAVVSASGRQRDLWTGTLLTAGRITPDTYRADPTLSSVLGMLPFGLPDEPPSRTGIGMRSRLGLSDDDVVVLWNGGLWNWFDPITVVHAALLAAKEEPRLRLVFLAGPRPRAGRGEDAMNRQVRALAGELDPQAHVVKFVENWVPYRERADYLLDADAAVCAHQDHLETRLAFRTRILDALWAGLPVITTDGDVWAELIERAGAGLVVPCEDVGGMADALVTLGASPEHRRAMGVAAAALADGYRWSRIAADVAPTLDPAAPRLASVSSLRLRLSGLRLRATQAREAIGLLAQGGPRRSRR